MEQLHAAAPAAAPSQPFHHSASVTCLRHTYTPTNTQTHTHTHTHTLTNTTHTHTHTWKRDKSIAAGEAEVVVGARPPTPAPTLAPPADEVRRWQGDGEGPADVTPRVSIAQAAFEPAHTHHTHTAPAHEYIHIYV